ncbi:TetR/AcrR family transcriptional regulator [Brevibacillus panacihumi]|uniref:TetR/AcrR family transcriptional regulator n=2 Tax=Brevibacillus panacihumi TaxID=497735 RepID=A0A3M8CCT2_9BACL|nr:TetR/AcrR family transcriptional regulator [Brevibacillus panacihumi]
MREKKKNARYKSIVKTAEQLFLENGLDAVQMQDVADADGIGIATLFRYFPKKERLIVAVAVSCLEKIVEDFQRIVTANSSAYDRLEQVLDYLMGHPTEKEEVWKSARFREAFESYASFAKKSLDGIEEYIETQKVIALILMKIIEDGKVDGSIRKDIPVKEAIITIVNAYGTFGNNISLKSAISYLEEDIAIHIQQRMLKEILLSYLRP